MLPPTHSTMGGRMVASEGFLGQMGRPGVGATFRSAYAAFCSESARPTCSVFFGGPPIRPLDSMRTCQTDGSGPVRLARRLDCSHQTRSVPTHAGRGRQVLRRVGR